MGKEKITAKQQEVYDFIKSYIESNGYSPSTRDIGVGVSLKSTSSVFSHLENLKRKGYIDFNESSPRTITLCVYRVRLEKIEDDEEVTEEEP